MSLLMCTFFQSINKKIRKRKKKNVHFQESSFSNEFHPFQYTGYFQFERLPPSTNNGFFIYDVHSIEHQTCELMLDGFRRLYTPMDLNNDSNGSKIYWIDVLWRGQLPLFESDHQEFHIPKRLKQILNSQKFTVTVDEDFHGVVTGCASITGENRRNLSWINPEICRLMSQLYEMGYAHSVETWQNGKLVGGLYGVSIGGYFTIESQFSFVKHSSKVALVHLVARLRLGGFRLLDIVEITSHLLQFGAYELFRNDFIQRAKEAMSINTIWYGNNLSPEIIQNEIRQIGKIKS